MKFQATCIEAGYNTKLDDEGRMILTKEQILAGKYKSTQIDKQKKDADFLLIEIGAKPLIFWKKGSVERLKSRKALEKLQAKFKWKCDF